MDNEWYNTQLSKQAKCWRCEWNKKDFNIKVAQPQTKHLWRSFSAKIVKR